MVYVGLFILVAAVCCLVKRMETRMVLIAAGFLMAILSGRPMDAFNGFTKAMTNSNLVMNIVSVMGFAYVMNVTKCNAHLVHGATSILRHVGWLMIPMGVLITFAINIALPSAAGCAAAVGAILIPMLIGAGVKPEMAASTVMMGTFGSMLSPGLTHNIYIHDLTTKFPTLTADGTTAVVPTSIIDVIARHMNVDLISCLICAISLFVIALIFKENKGYVDKENKYGLAEDLKVNPIYAVIPLIPIILLLLSSKAFPLHIDLLVAAKLKVAHCMIIGAFLGMLCTRTSPTLATKSFFTGGGKGYGDIMGIIIAAGVFTAGLKSIGLVDACITMMKSSESSATLAAAIGPYLLAIVSGSGDAATLAFNEAITSQAPLFHMSIVDMGSLATLAACLGRTMSPIAGACIVCAGLGLVDPLEIAKRNAVGCVIALVVSYVLLVMV